MTLPPSHPEPRAPLCECDSTATSGVDQERSTASTTDQQESPVHPRTIPAEIARCAHYLISDRQWTRKSAAKMLATIARRLNALTTDGRAWSDDDMRQLLGRAAHFGDSRLVVVLHDGASTTELDSLAGVSVLAVDPSRSTPEKAEP